MYFTFQNPFIPQQRVVWHIVFWLFYFLFFTSTYGGYSDNYGQAANEILVSMPVIIFATYFTLYYLLPKYLLTRRYLAFFVGLACSAFCFGFMQRGVAQYVIYPYLLQETPEHGLFVPFKIFKNIINIYSIVSAAVAIRLVKIAYQNEYERERLAKEKLSAELKFLKSQIHPHFLFNTLNNLYALTLKNSPKAPEVVLKLSNLLDYMLFESNVQQVPLAKEIELINNYIALEKIRHGEQVEVSFNFSVESLNKSIAPLLLFPLVENSFKHSSLGKPNEPTFVFIDMTIKGRVLKIKIENSTPNQQGNQPQNYESISLENVQRRLKLLYPNRYDLHVFSEEDRFLIVLTIEIDDLTTSPILSPSL